MRTLALLIICGLPLVSCGGGRENSRRVVVEDDQAWTLSPTDAIQSLTAHSRSRSWPAIQAFVRGAASVDIGTSTQVVEMAGAYLHLFDEPSKDSIAAAAVPVDPRETQRAFRAMSALAAWLTMSDVTPEIHYGSEVVLDPKRTVVQVEDAIAADSATGCVVTRRTVIDALILIKTCGRFEWIFEIGRAGRRARTLAVFNRHDPRMSARDLSSLLEMVYQRPVVVSSIPTNPYLVEIK